MSQICFTSQELTPRDFFDTGCFYCSDFVLVQTRAANTTEILPGYTYMVALESCGSGCGN